jgi:transcription antitermination factor NusG
MDLDRMHECWFAIQVKPRHEFATARLLRSKGYEEFVPSYRSRRQWTDRVKVIDAPLFTGYVFCRFNAEIRWPVISTEGVIRVVGNSQGPEAIPDYEIESIRKIMVSGLDLLPCDYLKTGDRARIAVGPLAGVEGKLTGIRNRRQLILSIDLLQRSVVVDVDQCCTINGIPIQLPGAEYGAQALGRVC